MSKAYERIETPQHDGLIVDINPPADVFAVKVKAGQGVLKRGSLMSLADGKVSLMNTGGTANCILAEDVDATEAVNGLAYRTGHFAVDKLIVAEGYKITAADKEALRDVGILLSDAMEY